MRSASVMASVRSCVTQIIVLLRRWCSRLISTLRPERSFASRLLSGSSERKTSASRTSALPMPARCLCPPGSAAGRVFSNGLVWSVWAASFTCILVLALGRPPLRRLKLRLPLTPDHSSSLSSTFVSAAAISPAGTATTPNPHISMTNVNIFPPTVIG